MVKSNPEYMRQYEFCRKMAGQAKFADLKQAWQDLAANWLALAESPRKLFELGKPAAGPSGPALHLKRFARS